MRTSLKFFAAIALAVLFSSCTKDVAKPEPPVETCEQVSFSQDIQPIIVAQCTSCHTSAYLCGALTDYSSIKEKYTNGTLRQRVLVQKDMPAGSTLTEAQLKKINCWIEQGAPEN
jgi:hypothetical protein